MISVLGAVFVLLIGLALLFRRELLPWILSAAVPFSATAGITIAGQSIVMYHVVAIVVVAVALQRHRFSGVVSADLDSKPGARTLLAFGAWACAVTAIAPFAFAGIKVLDPREGIDEGVKAPADLAPSISNIAQSGYLLIGIATVFALASTRGLSPRLPALGFTVGTALSSMRSLLPTPLQKSLFDNSANVTYTSGEFDGIERMRGIFSEPSALGAFSVAAVVFFWMSASNVRGVSRLLCILLGFWALVNSVLSFSGGALVSGILVFLVVAGQRAYLFVRGRLKLSPGAVVGLFLTVPATVIAGPTVYNFVTAILNDKTGSSSYENRNAADAFSYSLTNNTLALGAGLGSNRPSSFMASLLSTTGVLGVVLFAAFTLIIVSRVVRDPRLLPSVGALVSILISKIVAGPGVTDPPMWFLFALLAGFAWSEAGENVAGTRVDGPLTNERASYAPSPFFSGESGSNFCGSTSVTTPPLRAQRDQQPRTLGGL